jgi:pyruvate kinase
VLFRSLCLLRGVTPSLEEPYHDLDDMTAKAVRAARALGLAEPGQLLVCTAGVPFSLHHGTNLVRVVGVR